MFLTKLRLTSAMRTCKLTCKGVAARKRLITPTLSAASGPIATPGLSSAVTRRCAAALSSGEDTVPVSTAICPTVVTLMSLSGMASFTIRSIEDRFWLTRMLAA